jgi:hypothetical protein
MLIKPLVYLCGPVHGLNYATANSWRDVAATQLAPEFDILSPLHNHGWDGTDRSHFTDAEIVTRGLAYIRRARAVLRYYSGTSSEGSAMETLYASQQGVPVVTWGSARQRAELPVWLRYHTVRNFAVLDDAVAYLKSDWLLPSEAVEPLYNAEIHLDGRNIASALWREARRRERFHPLTDG